MKKFWLTLGLIAGSLLIGSAALAQFNGGSGDEPFTAPGLFSVNGSTVYFSDPSFVLGSASNPIANGYFTNATIGTLVISGTAPSGITAPWFVATSTSVTSTFAGSVSSTRYIGNTGSQTLPTYAFTGHPNTGLFDISGQLGVSELGVEVGLFDASGFRTMNIYPFSDGLYDMGDATRKWKNGWFNQINASTTNGSSVDALTVTGTSKITQIFAGSGSVSSPGYTFSAHTNTGLFDFSGQLRMAVQGVNALVLESTGMDTLGILPLTNGVSDIGSAALNYRNGWFGQLNASTTGGLSIPAFQATGTANVTGNGSAALQVCGGTAGNCNALAYGAINVSQATGIFNVNGQGGSTDLGLGARGSGVIVMTNADFSPNSGKGTDKIALGVPSLRFGVGNIAFVTSTSVTATNIYVNNVTTGRAACFKSDKSIGFCSTTVDASGNCTCN